MRWLESAPDGGPESGLTAHFLVEIKPLFSVVLLHFKRGTRDVFHEHAFNALTIWLKGRVREHHRNGKVLEFKAGNIKYTPRATCHKVEPLPGAWAICFRGPWKNTWREWRKDRWVTLTHGRKEI